MFASLNWLGLGLVSLVVGGFIGLVIYTSDRTRGRHQR